VLIITGYILFLGLINTIISEKINKSKIFIIFAGFLLFLISTFRSIYFAPDVVGYVNEYMSLSYRDLGELWRNFISNTGKDPIFYIVAKIINMFGASYREWLAIIAGFFCFAVSKLIYRYSDENYLSFVVLISLGFFYFSLTGLRQTVALSIILLSYKYLRERKLWIFIIIVVLSSLFHISALIFLIAYPIANMKIGWKQVIGISISLALVFLFKELLIKILYFLNIEDRFGSYLEGATTLTFSGFIIQLCVYLFCLFYKRRVLENDDKNISLYNLLFLGLVFQAFSTIIAEFFRISMYFSIFSIILIPKAINVEKDKKLRVIVYFAVFVALVAYIFWSRSFSGFKFFWQE